MKRNKLQSQSESPRRPTISYICYKHFKHYKNITAEPFNQILRYICKILHLVYKIPVVLDITTKNIIAYRTKQTNWYKDLIN